MRLEEVDYEPVPLREVPAATAAIEKKRLRAPRRRGNRHLELVLDLEGREPKVVGPSPVQRALGQKVGELDSSGVALPLGEAERMLLEKPPDVVLALGFGTLAVRPAHIQDVPPPYAIELVVQHPLGGD